MPLRLSLAAVAAASACLAVSTLAAVAAPPRMRTAPLGSVFTISGYTTGMPGSSTRADGRVLARARWAGERRWRFLRSTRTSHGHYRVSFTPSRRGTLTVSVLTPDSRETFFILHVV